MFPSSLIAAPPNPRDACRQEVQAFSREALASRVPLARGQLANFRKNFVSIGNRCVALSRSVVGTDRVAAELSVDLIRAFNALSTRNKACGTPVNLQSAAVYVLEKRLLDNGRRIEDLPAGIFPPAMRGLMHDHALIGMPLKARLYQEDMQMLMNWPGIVRQRDIPDGINRFAPRYQTALVDRINAVQKGLRMHHGLARKEALSNYEIQLLTDLLHDAIKDGDVRVVEILIRAGADVNGTTRECFRPPLGVALRGGMHELMEILLKAGADPNGYYWVGQTLLDEARERNDIQATELLDRFGAVTDNAEVVRPRRQVFGDLIEVSPIVGRLLRFQSLIL